MSAIWPQALAFDTETWLIRPGLQTPPVVCLTYSVIGVEPGTGLRRAGEPVILGRLDALAAFRSWLRNGVQVFGANAAFDVQALCVTADLVDGSGGELLVELASAYDRGQIRDVLIDQKLVDNAAGCLGLEQLPSGKWVNNRYNLAAVAKRCCGLELDKSGDTWRLRYGELDGTPVEAWPEAAREYAQLDAYATAATAIAQNTPGATRWQQMAESGFLGLDILGQSEEQARAALALSAMSAYGMRTDAPQVERYAAYVEAEYARVCESLAESGLVWIEYLRPETGMYTDRKTWNLLKRALRKRAATPADWAFFCAKIGAGVEYHKSTKVAAKMMYDWCTERGLPIVHTDSYAPKPPPKGKGHAPSECIALDKHSTRQSGCELLQTYSEVSHLSKMVSADLKWLRLGATEPIHCHLDSLKETNRTGASKPNLQNRARGGKDPGDRECFVPREGWVFLDADYEQGEMWTLAQVCHWWLGYTELGKSLRAGVDPHTKLGCAIAGGIPYEQGAALHKIKDCAFENERNAAKPLNFGRPGRLGAKTMTEYAAKGYGVERPLEFWQWAITLFDNTWTEMPDYFAKIDKCEAEPWPWQAKLAAAEADAAAAKDEKFRAPSYYNIALPTGFLRGRTHYTSACNTPYQSVLATVLKRACWRVWRACYADRADALFGSRPVLEIHDQLLVETRLGAPSLAGDGLDAARAAAKSLTHHMCEAAREVCPDYPTYTETTICERWSKKSKSVHGADGRQIVWRDDRIERQGA